MNYQRTRHNLGNFNCLTNSNVYRKFTYIFRRVRKAAKSDCWLRHICPYVRPSADMEQFGPQWTDFDET